tara:strand:+ start:618 stop:1160 length:543 start_codon:yes stop_codon:yes gene_type:complete
MKINLKNTDKLEAALANVNGRATANTVTTAGEVARICEAVESDMLARGATKKALHGMVVRYIPAGPGAKAYKYCAITTEIRCARTASGWFLLNCARAEMHPTEKAIRAISLPDAAKQQIVDHALRDTVARAFTTQAAAETIKKLVDALEFAGWYIEQNCENPKPDRALAVISAALASARG